MFEVSFSPRLPPRKPVEIPIMGEHGGGKIIGEDYRREPGNGHKKLTLSGPMLD